MLDRVTHQVTITRVTHHVTTTCTVCSDTLLMEDYFKFQQILTRQGMAVRESLRTSTRKQPALRLQCVVPTNT